MSIRFVVTRFCLFVHAFSQTHLFGCHPFPLRGICQKTLKTSVQAPAFAMFVVGQHFSLVSHPTFCIAVRLCL